MHSRLILAMHFLERGDHIFGGFLYLIEFSIRGHLILRGLPLTCVYVQYGQSVGRVVVLGEGMTRLAEFPLSD